MKSIKKSVLVSLLLIGFVAALQLAFHPATESHAVASVQKLEGYYIFVKSEPVSAYERVGTLKSPGMVKSTTLNFMLEMYIKKAKKEYPTADALLFNSSSETGMSTCEVIKFK